MFGFWKRKKKQEVRPGAPVKPVTAPFVSKPVETKKSDDLFGLTNPLSLMNPLNPLNPLSPFSPIFSGQAAASPAKVSEDPAPTPSSYTPPETPSYGSRETYGSGYSSSVDSAPSYSSPSPSYESSSPSYSPSYDSSPSFSSPSDGGGSW